MMKNIFYRFAFFLLLVSCSNATHYGSPEVNPLEIQKNFMDWWTYHYNNVMLSRDFFGLDANAKEISKEEFLIALRDGGFIPIRLNSSNEENFHYQLFKIEPSSDTSIQATIAEEAFSTLHNYKKEGTAFPNFSFKDLDGNLISNDNLKGKIVVVKCWFIHCVACIEEFPEVNAMAAKYKNRKDIVFISLAEDTPEQLRTFLAKRPLSYSVVPNLKLYMNETLQINGFPTHFIVNKEGIIEKVTSNYHDLAVALQQVSSEK
ncbi:TlpA disulfide reductase family protein [Flavobacterium sp.]|uniref:TlpA family protein disulfide reductase n=1 Tax=Flavobacterium sp. TaxID=239 RepID=UPI00261E24FB|nr:TlpA disulfide reductase family protein [Flavobacterium sp.]MDG2433363.1 TlpA disulfide reductase family protein [Flavobacterium sp.]